MEVLGQHKEKECTPSRETWVYCKLIHVNSCPSLAASAITNKVSFSPIKENRVRNEIQINIKYIYIMYIYIYISISSSIFWYVSDLRMVEIKALQINTKTKDQRDHTIVHRGLREVQWLYQWCHISFPLHQFQLPFC